MNTLLQKVPVRWQLGIGFSSAVVLTAALLLLIAAKITQLASGVEQINRHSLPLVLAVDEMDLSRSDVQQFLTDVAATHDEDGFKDAAAAAARFDQDVEVFRQHYRAQHNDAGLAQIDALSTHFRRYTEMGQDMARVYLAQGMDAGNRIMKGTADAPGFDAVSDALQHEMKAFRQKQVDEANAIAAQAEDAAMRVRKWMSIGIVTSIVLAWLLGTWIVRSVTGLLGGEPKDAVHIAQQVANGNLCVPIQVQAGDDHSLIAQLAHMQAALAGLCHQVREGAQSVAAASEQIAQGNQDLNARTAQHASSMQQTSSSIGTFTEGIRHSTDCSVQACEIARNAADVAAQSASLVTDVTATMQGIQDSSRRIGDIIGVIDGIAFQTNILALNAAVEAARAGDQGRGFAVVAAEVRQLARKSSEAAKEIKALIQTSIDRVDQGANVVGSVGSTLDGALREISRVSTLMISITESSKRQSHEVGEFADAVDVIDRGVQQNAALVEEMSAATNSLHEQATRLVATVSKFKLHDAIE